MPYKEGGVCWKGMKRNRTRKHYSSGVSDKRCGIIFFFLMLRNTRSSFKKYLHKVYDAVATDTHMKLGHNPMTQQWFIPFQGWSLRRTFLTQNKDLLFLSDPEPKPEWLSWQRDVNSWRNSFAMACTVSSGSSVYMRSPKSELLTKFGYSQI